MTLGKLIKVELRDVWANEATDFTPWLAKDENLEELSETLGMDLEATSTEHSVGSFRADMLCKDAYSGKSVLIENQLEKTNHTHLGQILTYCAGLDVKTIIWIASRFTDEHRAALDFLNEITEEDVSFFGLEVELWKIGNSVPAPKFNIVSRPNTWTKSLRENYQHGGEISDLKQQQLLYWTAFREYMEARNSPVKCHKAGPHHWINMRIGKSGFWLNARVNSQKLLIATDFNVKTKGSKHLYEQFLSQKDAIESEFGNSLNWNELPDKQVSIIGCFKENTDFRNEANWQEQFEWLATNVEKLDKVFRKRVKNLVAD